MVLQAHVLFSKWKIKTDSKEFEIETEAPGIIDDLSRAEIGC